MLDVWLTFPATMGDDQAWITFNKGYAEVAEEDHRHSSVRFRVEIKNPTAQGMPTNEEFPALSGLDQMLEDAIANIGGVYVGRITVAGNRYFYYYVDAPEKSLKQTAGEISKAAGYALGLIYESDPKKSHYWNDLYPTADDWQVIRDLKVLDALRENGDKQEIEREIKHWAHFTTQQNAQAFVSWAKKNNYLIENEEHLKDEDRFLVVYTHRGTTRLRDITHHTIQSGRKARELKGDYDGWETQVNN